MDQPKSSLPKKDSLKSRKKIPKVNISGVLAAKTAKKVAQAPAQITEVVKDAQVVKDTKKSIKKAQVKTEEYVKGEDQAPDTKAPKRIKAKSLRYQRDKVLKEGKKFVYPLRHAKHRIAKVSLAIGVSMILLVGLISYLSLYKSQTNNDLFYRLTQIVPFPVGKVNDETVRYEEYLFELNNATHFIENFENINFSTDEGQEQLEQIKLQVRDKVIENSVVRQLAKQFNVEVTDEEIKTESDSFRQLNGVVEEEEGQNDKLLASIKTTFDWDLGDFERELELQILKRKIVPLLDTTNRERAEKALAELKSGKEFKAVAQEYTDDNGTKPTGGEFPEPVSQDNKDLPGTLVTTGFGLEEGTYSDIIQTVFETNEGANAVALNIVVNNQIVDSSSRKLGHILFLYDSFENLAKSQLDSAKENANFYIDFTEQEPQAEEQEADEAEEQS